MQAIRPTASGRCHEAFNVVGLVLRKPTDTSDSFDKTVKPDEVEILPANHVFCSILWAGGWDEFIVDTTQVSEQTPKEVADGIASVKRGAGLDPIITRNGVNMGTWLRGEFTKGLIQKRQCIRIVRRLAHGD